MDPRPGWNLPAGFTCIASIGRSWVVLAGDKGEILRAFSEESEGAQVGHETVHV